MPDVIQGLAQAAVKPDSQQLGASVQRSKHNLTSRAQLMQAGGGLVLHTKCLSKQACCNLNAFLPILCPRPAKSKP